MTNQIILQPASVDCLNFQPELITAVVPVVSMKVIIVPIKLRVENTEVESAYTLAYACNMQSQCHNPDCLYARLKEKKAGGFSYS